MSDASIKNLKGPIAVFGAGGFIGINLMHTLANVRKDIVGFSQHPSASTRIKKSKLKKHLFAQCDITNAKKLAAAVRRLKPQTIFNLAAYGAYSFQNDIEKIYKTNITATAMLLEELSRYQFSAYIHAGSQSEYGLNAAAPRENDELIPNSHYAVTKAADFFLLKYYGKVKLLPVAHARLYSVYGSYEEPTRLMPTIISHVKRGVLPPFVDAAISRDFVYVDDAVEALIMLAGQLKQKHYGQAYNIASGKKTTIKQLAFLSKKLFAIQDQPVFATMKSRAWDLKNWYGNPEKIRKEFGWRATTTLENGMLQLYNETK